MIKPALGRIVWFTPAGTAPAIPTESDGRCAAIIVKVWDDRLVNLTVFDANGNSHPTTSVRLVQEGDSKPEGGYFAEWMPYQQQAAKEKQLAGNGTR